MSTSQIRSGRVRLKTQRCLAAAVVAGESPRNVRSTARDVRPRAAPAPARGRFPAGFLGAMAVLLLVGAAVVAAAVAALPPKPDPGDAAGWLWWTPAALFAVAWGCLALVGLVLLVMPSSWRAEPPATGAAADAESDWQRTGWRGKVGTWVAAFAVLALVPAAALLLARATQGPKPRPTLLESLGAPWWVIPYVLALQAGLFLAGRWMVRSDPGRRARR